MPLDDLEPILVLIQKSGLLDDSRIDEAVDGFTKLVKTEGSPAIVADFQEFLVANEYLTRWQTKKLAQGRFKGFFLDHYVLLGHVGRTAKYTSFAVQDSRTGKDVVLDVYPRKDPPYFHYVVGDEYAN